MRIVDCGLWIDRVVAVLALLFCASVACAQSSSTVAPILKLLESGRVPKERQAAMVEMICSRGEAADLAVAFKLAAKSDGLSPELRRRVLELLAEAATTRKVKPAGDLSPLVSLIEVEGRQDSALRLAAIRLAAAWRMPEAAATLQKLAAGGGDAALQQAALEGLVSIDGDRSRDTLQAIAREGKAIGVRVTAAASLARIDSAAAAVAAAEILQSASPQDDIRPMLDALLGRKGGADRLAAALEAQPIPADAAKIALRHMYSVGRSDAALSNVLSKAAGIALDAPPPSQEEVAKIAAEVAANGDAERGEKIFRRADLSCMKCHSVAQAGGAVGPELSAVGSISPVDYVVNSILNPNLAVKEQFVTRRVLTFDGEVLTGVQIDRDDQKLRLRDAAGRTIVIPADNIDQEGEGASLMPQGLTKFLTHQEFLDLAKFVSLLGKPGPYAIRKTPSIQRWRVLQEPGPDLVNEVPNVEILREQVLDAPADAWTTAYGTVGGMLPLAEVAFQRPAVVYLQGEFEMIESGEIAVEVESTEKLQLWIGAEPFAGNSAKLVLTEGKFPITVRVEVSDRADPQIKVELTRPEKSVAQFVVINGQ